jgi:cyclophilin family peptidyl-prolyl cis-trans isomerase
MKRIFSLLTLVIAITLTSCKEDKNTKLPDGLYAEIETSKGTILLELEFQKTPITVANFVTLAEGTNPFVAENLKGKSFYDGLKFHRVIENFMIQGGDPDGNGSGGAGYNFKDEITDLKFDKGGLLAMANSGPGTNSSQFFITHLQTPWLDGKHTIFGHVIENGMQVVNTIVQDDEINSVKIIRKGEAAKKFNAVKIFSDYFGTAAESQKKEAEINAANLLKVTTDKLAFFADKKSSATKTASGLQYNVYEKGTSGKAAKGTILYVNYAGFLENGTLFDSSDVELVKSFGKYDSRRADQNGYKALPYVVGGKSGMIPGFEEGLSHLNVGDKAVLFIPSNLAYGPTGIGDVIPANANIIFEVQLSDSKQ